MPKFRYAKPVVRPLWLHGWLVRYLDIYLFYVYGYNLLGADHRGRTGNKKWSRRYSKLEKLSHSAHLCQVLPSGECCSNEPIFEKYLQTTICLKKFVNSCPELLELPWTQTDRQTDRQTNANKNVTYLAEVISYNVLNSNTRFKA